MNRSRLKQQPPGQGAAADGVTTTAGASYCQSHSSTFPPVFNLTIAPDPLTFAEWCEIESTRLKILAEYIRTTQALALLGEV